MYCVQTFTMLLRVFRCHYCQSHNARDFGPMITKAWLCSWLFFGCLLLPLLFVRKWEERWLIQERLVIRDVSQFMPTSAVHQPRSLELDIININNCFASQLRQVVWWVKRRTSWYSLINIANRSPDSESSLNAARLTLGIHADVQQAIHGYLSSNRDIIFNLFFMEPFVYYTVHSFSAQWRLSYLLLGVFCRCMCQKFDRSSLSRYLNIPS